MEFKWDSSEIMDDLEDYTVAEWVDESGDDLEQESDMTEQRVLDTNIWWSSTLLFLWPERYTLLKNSFLVVKERDTVLVWVFMSNRKACYWVRHTWPMKGSPLASSDSGTPANWDSKISNFPSLDRPSASSIHLEAPPSMYMVQRSQSGLGVALLWSFSKSSVSLSLSACVWLQRPWRALKTEGTEIIAMWRIKLDLMQDDVHRIFFDVPRSL